MRLLSPQSPGRRRVAVTDGGPAQASGRAAMPPAGVRDKLLFTPGPLTTSRTVKEAMLHDAGSWHFEFNDEVKRIRQRLLAVAGVSEAMGWEAIPLQGSGTFAVEAVFATCVPPQGKVAVPANGAYGERMALMLRQAGIDHLVLRTSEDRVNDPRALAACLATDPAVTHVAAVHVETTTGILNPIADLGRVTRASGRVFILDAMSSFGALPLDLAEADIDFLIASPNKCLEGVPGFAFVLARRAALLACEGWARSLSLDLLGQLKGFERNGQFRFTPPTHALLALARALAELEAEGGVAARGARYQRNHRCLLAGMARLGFVPYLEPGIQSFIITAFHFPADPRFSFEAFYQRLSDRGFLIYPGKISQVPLFRIGSIGRIEEADIAALLVAVEASLRAMGLGLPLPR